MKITIIGLRRLGVVAASGLAAAGHEVTGLDVDEGRVEALRSGHIPFYEPGLEECVNASVSLGNLRFLRSVDMTNELGGVALVTAGTPALANGKVDLRQVRDVLAWVKSRKPKDLVLLMKSTVPPGSGVEFLRKELNGVEVDYIANPEFLREGRGLHDWKYPDRVVLGTGSCAGKAIDTVREMYSGIESPFLITDINSAEMIKYVSNAFLATRISFINEMASLCDAVGASIDAVSDGLAMDARTGARIFAGIGYGGSCLPKDIQALRHLAISSGIESNLLREVSKVNDQQRRLPIEKLNARFQGCLTGLQVGVLGLAFKPGTDDVREAASLELIRELVEKGTKVKAFDPQASASARGLLPSDVELVGAAEEAAEGAQALVLVTEWPEIIGADWESMAAHMCSPRFLFDGRNALDGRHMAQHGFEYAGVGRAGLLGSNLVPADENNEARNPPPVARTTHSIPQLAARQSELRYA